MVMSQRTPKTQRENRAQLAAFRKAARAAGCDDNEERFQGALRKIAKAKPSVEKPKRTQQHHPDKGKD
jgi:hypothetical protein